MDETFAVDAADYDNTIAQTFVPSPSGMDVATAYRAATRDMFGSETLLDEIGGVQNRTPSEIVSAILRIAPRTSVCAARFAKRYAYDIGEVMRRQYISEQHRTRTMLSEALVFAKLEHLMAEISGRWPKPFAGFPEYFELLRIHNIPFVIVSSGHTRFITRTFEVWKMSCPSVILSDDDMRPMDLAPEKKSKPHRLVIAMLRMKIWTELQFSPTIRKYLGDCEIKDRGLAKNADLQFGWFNPTGKERPPDFGDNEFEFRHWGDLAPIH